MTVTQHMITILHILNGVKKLIIALPVLFITWLIAIGKGDEEAAAFINKYLG